MTGFLRHGWVAFVVSLAWVVCPAVARAQENLLANPGFEAVAPNGFFADWGQGSPAKAGKAWFVDHATTFGKSCLRMVGTPQTWTTCEGESITVQPNRNYWLSWRFRAKQPPTSRTYLFLQTNLGQRVFSSTDQMGDFDWAQHIVKYRTKPGETQLRVVLAMQTREIGTSPPGTSWWDDLGVWEQLPPDLVGVYRQEHPWDDVHVVTAQRLGQPAGCQIWGDRAEVRIGPTTPLPAGAGKSEKIRLRAPGLGHDVYQLIVAPSEPLEPVSLQFSAISGPSKLPASCLSYRVLRCVPVQETRDKTFPHGPTPDPLVAPARPEPAQPGENLVFWIEWAPPVKTAPGDYKAQLTVQSGKRPLATIPLELHRWAFDLPYVSSFRSLVMSRRRSSTLLSQRSEEDVLRLAWRLLGSHRLSGFNRGCAHGGTQEWQTGCRLEAVRPKAGLAGVPCQRDQRGGPCWRRCSQGWQPHKFAGLVPLADKEFDALYVQYNRMLSSRVRQYGLSTWPTSTLRRARARLHGQDRPALRPDPPGRSSLKCMTTVDPQLPGRSGQDRGVVYPLDHLEARGARSLPRPGRRDLVYNMTAAIEDAPLDHRLYMWMAFQAQARGGMLWNSCWWNKINPWENPTAAPVPVGREGEQLYHYQAGQASLFYPDQAGKGPLVPSLRLVLIRQGVEDFDILSQLAAAWDKLQPRLSAKARQDRVSAAARQALIAPVMLGWLTSTTSPARVEAIRRLAANELEVATQQPTVIAYPGRTADGRLGVIGYVEADTNLTLSGRNVTIDEIGRFKVPLDAKELAVGLNWTAEKTVEKTIEKTTEKGIQKSIEKSTLRKTWQWPGLK